MKEFTLKLPMEQSGKIEVNLTNEQIIELAEMIVSRLNVSRKNDNEERWVSGKEALKILGRKTYDSLYRRVSAGELRTRRNGTQIVYLAADLLPKEI